MPASDAQDHVKEAWPLTGSHGLPGVLTVPLEALKHLKHFQHHHAMLAVCPLTPGTKNI